MFLRKILMVLGCIILYPLAVALGPSIFMTIFWVVGFYKAHGLCAAIAALALFPIPFILGLILDICWIPLAVIGLPTAFVMFISTQVVGRYQNKQQAMQRI